MNLCIRMEGSVKALLMLMISYLRNADTLR